MRSLVRTVLWAWLAVILSTGVAPAQSVLQQVLPGQQPAQEQPADNDAQTAPAADQQQTPAQQGAQPPAAQPAAEAVPLPPGISEAAAKARRQAGQFTATLDELDAKLTNPSLSREELNQLRLDAESVREQVRQATQELAGPIKQIDDQIARLGPAPKEGESEPETVAAQRARLMQAKDQLAGARAQLALVAGAAEQMSASAAQTERTRFLNRLFGQSRSVLNPVLWTDAAARLPQLWERSVLLFTSFHDTLSQARGAWAPWLLLGALLTLIAATVAICRMIARRARHGVPGEAEFQKYLRTVIVPIGYTVVAGAAVFIFHQIFTAVSPDTPRMQRLVDSLGFSLVAFSFSRGVARSILSPSRADWRVAPLSSPAAHQWLWLATLAFGLIAFNDVRATLADIVNVDSSFDVGSNALVALLVALIAAQLVLTGRRDRIDGEHAETGLKPAFGWANYLVQPVWLVILATFAAAVMGYIAFADYLSTNIFVISSVVALLYCIRCLSDAFVAQSLKPRSRISKMMKSAFSMSDRGLNRAGIALNAAVDLSLLLLGLPLVLATTSLTWVDVRSWLTTAFFGFQVGDITIEPSSILLALVVFMIGLGLTRFATGWLDRRILTPTDMDAGVRNSLRTASGYLATILVLLVAFAAAGVDFSNIALVAGALSVGIGFGLQSIVNNFVSGLILLAERPIKVGDWVQVTGGEGTVRKINVRATEIETFDRCSIIVPNSSLISDTVSNWTHGNLMGRVRVAVGVSYDADPKQVEDILMKCAQAHPRALEFPAVTVLFKDFGASSLDFEVRVFIDDVNWVAFVASDLRFEIYRALKDAGIEIPFPQQDVHLKGLKEALQGGSGVAGASPAGAKASGKPRSKRVRQRPTIGEIEDGDGGED